MLQELVLSHCLFMRLMDHKKCSTVLRGMFYLSYSGALSRYHLHTVLCMWAVPVSAFFLCAQLGLIAEMA